MKQEINDLNDAVSAQMAGQEVTIETKFIQTTPKSTVLRSEERESSTISTNSTGGHSEMEIQSAIYPPESWLDQWMKYGREQEESADCYLLGSILPVVGAALGRKVYFPWGDRKIYPNLFTILAGKPGDRKSSAINLAGKLARNVLDRKQFLPTNMSLEAMMDEYDDTQNGSPDKILICDDANIFLGNIGNKGNGERVGNQLLSLYDCKGFHEAFRRNKKEEGESVQRSIEETSTSICLGATFNIAQFQGHSTRSGLERRFLYYVAERHGRMLYLPPPSNYSRLEGLAEGLIWIRDHLKGSVSLNEKAARRWEQFQRDNRNRLNSESSDRILSRLNGQPEHVIKVAMIFLSCVSAEIRDGKPLSISLDILEKAIEHVELSLYSARHIDRIGNKESGRDESESFHARLCIDFEHRSKNGWIELTKTEITGKYCANPNRSGSLKSDTVYQKLIPDLIKTGHAKPSQKIGKKEVYAFLCEL